MSSTSGESASSFILRISPSAAAHFSLSVLDLVLDRIPEAKRAEVCTALNERSSLLIPSCYRTAREV